MKVICAGIPKTGTKTMAQALRMLGYNVHDVFEQFIYDRKLWYKVLDNTATKEDYIETLSSVDAVTDFPGCSLWEQILDAFPDAKVILMVRSSEDEWYKSIKYHFKHMTNMNQGVLMYPVLNLLLGPLHREFLKYMASFIPACLGSVYTWGAETEVLLRTRYRQHNMYVEAACPKENLLVFNAKEGWGPLCKFLGVDIPSQPFPRENVKTEIVDKVASGQYDYDCGYRNAVLKQTVTRIVIVLALVIALISYFLHSW